MGFSDFADPRIPGGLQSVEDWVKNGGGQPQPLPTEVIQPILRVSLRFLSRSGSALSSDASPKTSVVLSKS